MIKSAIKLMMPAIFAAALVATPAGVPVFAAVAAEEAAGAI